MKKPNKIKDLLWLVGKKKKKTLTLFFCEEKTIGSF